MLEHGTKEREALIGLAKFSFWTRLNEVWPFVVFTVDCKEKKTTTDDHVACVRNL